MLQSGRGFGTNDQGAYYAHFDTEDALGCILEALEMPQEMPPPHRTYASQAASQSAQAATQAGQQSAETANQTAQQNEEAANQAVQEGAETAKRTGRRSNS